MSSTPRSLVACLRCRKLKVKCKGRDGQPCVRCEASRAKCTFTASRPSLPSTGTQQKDRVTVLEERVEELETVISSSFQSMRWAIQHVSAHVGLKDLDDSLLGLAALSPEKNTTRTNDADESSDELCDAEQEQDDLVGKRILTETECRQLFDFFCTNCSESISFFDDTMESFETARQSPLLLAARCTIGARASAPTLYQRCLKETYSLIQNTLLGPVPSLETLKGIILMAIWHRNNRLWGLILSISYQMRLPEASLSLADRTARHAEDLVDRARTWLSFCCVDLIHNTNQTFLISAIDRYTGLGRYLVSMPHRRNVDYRICAYLEVYNIANQAQKELQLSGNSQTQPIPSGVCSLLQFYNQELESWFRRNTQGIDPIYQTFSKPQDRNRMAIPYNYIRMYINGFVLHGLKPDSSKSDPLRVQFIRTAVDAGKALLQCALQSMTYQTSLNYSIDYSGSALGLAINFLFRVARSAYDCVDVKDIMLILEQARKMFQSAKVTENADEVGQILDQIAGIERNIRTRSSDDDSPNPGYISETIDESMDFFMNARLPLSDFMLDDASFEDILRYSGE